MIGCIIQARMGSTRLPGKVMKKLDENFTVLDYVITQIKNSKLIDKIVIATTTLKEDDVIVFSKNATSSTSKIYINNKEKWTATAGASNNRKAIQIKSNIDHEKMETLNSLKEFNDERVERAKAASEAISKLIATRDVY